jgi:hypothetical protein
VSDAAPPWLPRLAAQLALAGGVALSVGYLLQSRDDAQDARLDSILSEIDLLRHERDRLAALNDALLDEAHAADREAELARWQLRYAEERLRRAEAEAEAAANPARAPAPRRLVLPVGAPPPPAPPALSPEALAAAIPLGPAGLPPADAPPAAASAAPLSATAGALPVGAVPFDPAIPPVRRAPSQLARDQAHTRWQGIIDEAVHEECAGRFGELAQLRCDDAVRRSLFAYGTHAVDCILSGNAIPDYIPGLGLRDLPTHAVPLARGAVILCDGALLNQAG